MDKELERHIRNRTRAENKMISLEKLLRVYKMDMYFKLCSNRIADAYLVDGKHVQINFVNFPDLLFDSKGIRNCFDILSGYIDEDVLISLYMYARSNDKITDCINAQLEILRASSIKTLLIGGFHTSKIKKELKDTERASELVKELSKMNREELFSRSIFNRVRVWIVKQSTQLYLKIRYWEVFSVLEACLKESG